MHRFITLLLFFSSFFVVNLSYSQYDFKTNSYDVYKCLDSLFENMVRDGNFNGSMLVADSSGIVYENINGYGNIKTRKPLLNKHSQFEIASVSKEFTAVSVLMLYKNGILNIDDSVSKYIRDFPYKDVTVRQLLCHRSGLPDYLEFVPKYLKKGMKMSNDELVRMLNIHKPKPEFPADSKFAYSNTAYAVLASIIESLVGESFTEFVSQNIFEPLQMSDTYFYKEGNIVDSNYTIGHRKNASVWYRDELSEVVGDKGIMTTAEDLYKWFSHLSILLPDSLLTMAWTPQNADMSDRYNYGFGWRLSSDEIGNRLVFHGGLWNGNNSILLYRPADKTFIVLLTNLLGGSIRGKSDIILDIMWRAHHNISQTGKDFSN